MSPQNIRIRLEEFISSDRGQRFFNFSYSIGAAVVIWGALFKILHLPGGDTLLTIGMGTEIIMFFLTAFDRPQIEQTSAQTFIEHSDKNDSAAASSQSANIISTDNQEILIGEIKDVVSEMSKLRETTTALNTLYELQLKSVSAQLSAFESGSRDVAAMKEMMSKSAEQSQRYCEETIKMADNMAQLNSIYERLIIAMSSGNTKSTN